MLCFLVCVFVYMEVDSMNEEKLYPLANAPLLLGFESHPALV